MKKTFIYIISTLAISACSSEESVVEKIAEEEIDGIRVELKDPVGIGDEDFSRTSLFYDDAKNVMTIRWADDDCIGVFTYPDASHSQELKFTQVVGDESNTDYLRRFQTQDEKYYVETDKKYVACYPYFANHIINYSNIEVDYKGQQQNYPVDFSDYKKSPDTNYKESQPKASAHLSGYDFLCTGPTVPTPNGGILFKMKRMGAIVRFWIVLDKKYNYVYDELQLVNRSKQFTTEAIMDAAATTLTPTKYSHMVNLKFAESGFDLTDVPADETSSTFYYWNNGKHSGSIMAYMMLAPINLQGDDVENCFIYLVAHEKGYPEKKHYFKSPGLSKPNLTPNAFYKWTIYPNEDTPIEFSEITVEEWREGTSFDNGTDGNGTAKW